MKPTIKLATSATPDGGEMVLYQHDNDFSIRINGLELMNSRQHESEQELARLGCAQLSSRAGVKILVGGLGLGYTLRQALDMLAEDASVVISELMPEVVIWNRDYLGSLNNNALEDRRVEVVDGDIYQLIAKTSDQFDAILLDVDNGPTAMVDSGNQRLYDPAGIQICRRALRKQGILAVWSTEPSKKYERFLKNGGFKVKRYKVKNYPGSKTKPLFIWVAAEDEAILPPGGSEPTQLDRKEPLENRKTTQKKVPANKLKSHKPSILPGKEHSRPQSKKGIPRPPYKEQV